MIQKKRLSPSARDAARDRADVALFDELRDEAAARQRKTDRLREARLAREAGDADGGS